MFRPIRVLGTAALAAGIASLACSSSTLAPASFDNVVDTITLYALSTGPLNQPNAYSINTGIGGGVETWNVGSNFEFAFDLDSAGQPAFLPLEVLNLTVPNTVLPGLIKATNTTFDLMTTPPSNGWITSDTIPIQVGDLYYVRTAVTTCATLGVPLYGKVEVLALDSVVLGDTVTHTVKFQSLANQNCGYRSLKPGVPSS
ncbi:MAG TPA: hypothetical protein VMG41_16845 [Gemmatimonadales bacterium]|nr:hypothetical protein [Gemmatimonadales bacterium]